jgi:hypothetical protein
VTATVESIPLIVAGISSADSPRGIDALVLTTLKVRPQRLRERPRKGNARAGRGALVRVGAKQLKAGDEALLADMSARRSDLPSAALIETRGAIRRCCTARAGRSHGVYFALERGRCA